MFFYLVCAVEEFINSTKITEKNRKRKGKEIFPPPVSEERDIGILRSCSLVCYSVKTELSSEDEIYFFTG